MDQPKSERRAMELEVVNVASVEFTKKIQRERTRKHHLDEKLQRVKQQIQARQRELLHSRKKVQCHKGSGVQQLDGRPRASPARPRAGPRPRGSRGRRRPWGGAAGSSVRRGRSGPASWVSGRTSGSGSSRAAVPCASSAAPSTSRRGRACRRGRGAMRRDMVEAAPPRRRRPAVHPRELHGPLLPEAAAPVDGVEDGHELAVGRAEAAVEQVDHRRQPDRRRAGEEQRVRDPGARLRCVEGGRARRRRRRVGRRAGGACRLMR